MVASSQTFSDQLVYKALFLTASFGFFGHMQCPNFLAPDSLQGGVFFQDKEVQLLMKWSKTMQYRNEYQLVLQPKLGAYTISHTGFTTCYGLVLAASQLSFIPGQDCLGLESVN